jgi:hypothetical protein
MDGSRLSVSSLWGPGTTHLAWPPVSLPCSSATSIRPPFTVKLSNGEVVSGRPDDVVGAVGVGVHRLGDAANISK